MIQTIMYIVEVWQKVLSRLVKDIKEKFSTVL